MGTFSRAFKHTKRAVTKLFGGANQANLAELAVVLEAARRVPKLGRNFPDSLAGLRLKHGEFNFNWILSLDEITFFRFLGEWEAQAPAGKSLATVLQNPSQHGITDAQWTGLQDTKNRYRAIAKANAISTFGRVTARMKRAEDSVQNRLYRNRLMGEYLMTAQTLNNLYEEADRTGAASDFEQKVLRGGGALNVLMASASLTKGILKLVGGGVADSKPIYGPVKAVVKSSAKLLDNLGGLLVGMGQLLTKSEANFQSLSGRSGLQQKVYDLKKSKLGPGADDARSLADQVSAGPQALQHSADTQTYDLDHLEKQFKHAIWWCKVWKLDIQNVLRELEQPDYIHQLKQIGLAQSGDACLKPSELAAAGALNGFEFQRDALKKQAEELHTKVERFQRWLEPHLALIDELRAAGDTRRSIADRQSDLQSAGVDFDAPLRLSEEIAKFDRSALRPVSPDEVRRTVEVSFLETAMRERRSALGYLDD